MVRCFFFPITPAPPHNSCEWAIKERQREGGREKDRERERGGETERGRDRQREGEGERERERGAALSPFSKTINVRNSEAGNYALS